MEYQVKDPLPGTKFNTDERYKNGIIKGLKLKQGYCPCRIGKEEQNFCHCEEYKNTLQCHCGLYVDDK